MGQIDQSGVWARAWRDFERRWLGVLVGVILGAIGAFSDTLQPQEPEWWHRILVFGAGVLVVALPLFLFGLVRAPYEQRQEARSAHAAHHAPLDLEIHVRSCFISKPPRSLAEPLWKLIRLGDFRVTNRSAAAVNLGFVLKFSLGGDSYFWLDENPIGRLKREGAHGFVALLDNPLRVEAVDTQAGDLGFLAEPDSVKLVESHLEGTFDQSIRSAILRITDHLSTQVVEIPNRSGTYQWADHIVTDQSRGD